jgi:PhnB protein
MIAVSTYLLLDGTCKDAMQFYQSCLGGELSISLVAETPMKSMFPPEMHNRVINAHLKAEGVSISASDWMLPTEKPVPGNTVCLFISGGTADETRSLFQKLSEGAEVTDPPSRQPFGLYGALSDRFGIRWMFHSGETGDA